MVVPRLEDDEPCTGEEDKQEELILDREAALFASLCLRWDIMNKRGPAYGYYVNPKKSVLVIKERCYQEATE